MPRVWQCRVLPARRTEEQALLIAKASGGSTPLRNFEAAQPVRGRCRLRRDARLHINPATLSHPMEGRNSMKAGARRLVVVARDRKFASYSLRRDVLEAFSNRLREDLVRG
jgi:ArsR family transcriptional regulator